MTYEAFRPPEKCVTCENMRIWVIVLLNGEEDSCSEPISRAWWYRSILVSELTGNQQDDALMTGDGTILTYLIRDRAPDQPCEALINARCQRKEEMAKVVSTVH